MRVLLFERVRVGGVARESGRERGRRVFDRLATLLRGHGQEKRLDVFGGLDAASGGELGKNGVAMVRVIAADEDRVHASP